MTFLRRGRHAVDFGCRDASRRLPELGRSKAKAISATCLTAETSQIDRILGSRPVRGEMPWCHRLRLDTGCVFQDFPARRNEFPVPDHREFVTMAAERLGNLGADCAGGVRYRKISPPRGPAGARHNTHTRPWCQNAACFSYSQPELRNSDQ